MCRKRIEDIDASPFPLVLGDLCDGGDVRGIAHGSHSARSCPQDYLTPRSLSTLTLAR